MKDDFSPILVIPAVPYEGGIRFLHQKEQLDLGPDAAETVWRILRYCNGLNSVDKISELSEVPVEIVSEILLELKDVQAIVDSKEQYLHFHRVSSYPTPFNRVLSQDEIREYTNTPRKSVKPGEKLTFRKDRNTALYSMREKRRSCRSFSDKALSIDQIGNICSYAYSIRDHAVPSGGALYPLKIYVLVEKDQENISAGYYEYDAEQDALIRFRKDVDAEQLKYCFNEGNLPFGSSVQIIIAADLDRQPYKYANRGYRLTLIEVGHAAENISLYCAEQGIGACEMGGVQDEPLMAELGLKHDEIYPMLAVAVGYQSFDRDNEAIEKIRYIESETGLGKPVERYWSRTFGADGSFFGASAVYKNANSEFQYSGATSTSYIDAVFKAAVEGYERWCSGQVRIDYYGPAKNLKNWIHPKHIAPLTKEQAQKCGTAYFNEDLPIRWTRGVHCDGQEIYIPSDIVYYGQKSAENRIYFGNSSGVAAHTDVQKAQELALIELIERDAVMRNWYTGQSPNIVDPRILPIHVRKRMEHWKAQSRKVYILEMPSKYGRVLEAMICSEEYPCFVCGAAAAIREADTESAVNKALREAEYNLLICLDCPDERVMDFESVLTPVDHGRIYHVNEYAKTLRWLWNGKVVGDFAPIPERGLDHLMKELEISTVDMSLPDSELNVVRVFSPKLVPIHFGFHSAHYTHPALHGEVSAQSLAMPHYFS